MISSMVNSGSKRASRAASEPQKRTNASCQAGIELRRAVFVVDIDHDQQSGAVKAGDGGFQLFAPLLDDIARFGIHDDARGNAEADVLESQAGHERRLALGNVVGEMLGRTAIEGKRNHRQTLAPWPGVQAAAGYGR